VTGRSPAGTPVHPTKIRVTKKKLSSDDVFIISFRSLKMTMIEAKFNSDCVSNLIT
jgi:hypothetical protein